MKVETAGLSFEVARLIRESAELKLRIGVLEERIIKVWHDGHTGTMLLHEALGMTEERYEEWVRERQARSPI